MAKPWHENLVHTKTSYCSEPCPVAPGTSSLLVLIVVVAALVLAGPPVTLAQESAQQALSTPAPSLWAGEVGEGFNRGAHELELSSGAGAGMAIFGTRQYHDWVLGAVDYGWVLTDVVGNGHWYRGNWELMADVFGGFQFHPNHAYLFGAAPLLRYDFATGTRLVPFVNIGAGVSGTDIRNGDLSTSFEFNLQFGAGVHWFLCDHAALTAQYRLMHLSNAGMEAPNLGVNNSTLLVGVAWWF